MIVELRAMMHTPIAAYKPKVDEEPKPSNYTIDAIGMSADEVSDQVNFTTLSLFVYCKPYSH